MELWPREVLQPTFLRNSEIRSPSIWTSFAGLMLRGPIRAGKTSSFSTTIAAVFHMLPITGPFPTPLKRPVAYHAVLFQGDVFFQTPFAFRPHEKTLFLDSETPSASFSRFAERDGRSLSHPFGPRSHCWSIRCNDAQLTVLLIQPIFVRRQGYRWTFQVTADAYK